MVSQKEELDILKNQIVVKRKAVVIKNEEQEEEKEKKEKQRKKEKDEKKLEEINDLISFNIYI